MKNIQANNMTNTLAQTAANNICTGFKRKCFIIQPPKIVPSTAPGSTEIPGNKHQVVRKYPYTNKLQLMQTYQ